MLEEIITDTNKFECEQLDHDIINFNKTFYNIYNNKINQALHKFVFLLNNVKFIKINQNQITFAINNKNIFINKFILFFKDLSNEIKKIFQSNFKNIALVEPWKEAFNYPYLLNVFIGNKFIIIDKDKNIIDVTQLNYENSYSILIEVSYLKLYGNLDEKKIKFKLSILMIQIEPEVDYKSFNLLKCIPQKNSIKIIERKINENTFVNNTHVTSNTGINLKELLEKKNSLKSIQKEEPIENNYNSNIIDIFLNKKNELKKVKTNEKTLFNKLKKKSINKKKALLELELENELNLLIL